MNAANKRVAIVCDWLIGGGAEKVVLELHKLFPDAPIYTSYCTPSWRKQLDNKVLTGWLQYWPFSRLRKFIPFLRIWWFSSLKLHGFDIVISSSGAEAKGVKIAPGAKHISIVFAPTHYYWSRYDEYIKSPGFGILSPLARLGLKALVKPLRKWDYKAAQKPDVLISISTHIRSQIKQYYNRDSIVIFPPVDVDKFKHAIGTERQGFIITGRQVPYKRIDLAVRACTELDLPLTIIGNGPEHKKLIKLAGPNCTFITNASDADMAELLAHSKAFIFPGLDDFGIAPVEAMAAGTPIIAYQAGGALDYVAPNKTGLFFKEQTVEELAKTILELEKVKFKQSEVINYSHKFSAENFQKSFLRFITEYAKSQ